MRKMKWKLKTCRNEKMSLSLLHQFILCWKQSLSSETVNWADGLPPQRYIASGNRKRRFIFPNFLHSPLTYSRSNSVEEKESKRKIRTWTSKIHTHTMYYSTLWLCRLCNFHSIFHPFCLNEQRKAKQSGGGRRRGRTNRSSYEFHSFFQVYSSHSSRRKGRRKRMKENAVNLSDSVLWWFGWQDNLISVNAHTRTGGTNQPMACHAKPHHFSYIAS